MTFCAVVAIKAERVGEGEGELLHSDGNDAATVFSDYVSPSRGAPHAQGEKLEVPRRKTPISPTTRGHPGAVAVARKTRERREMIPTATSQTRCLKCHNADEIQFHRPHH